MAKSNAEQPNDEATAEPITGGFSSGKIKRLIAVVLFLGVGTFAISQTIGSKSSTPDDNTAQVADGEASTEQTSKAAKSLKRNEATQSSAKVGNAQVGNAQNNAKPKKPILRKPVAVKEDPAQSLDNSRKTARNAQQNSTTQNKRRQPKSANKTSTPLNTGLALSERKNGQSNGATLKEPSTTNNGFTAPSQTTDSSTNSSRINQAPAKQAKSSLPSSDQTSQNNSLGTLRPKNAKSGQTKSAQESNGFAPPQTATNPNPPPSRPGLRPAVLGEPPTSPKTMADLGQAPAKPKLLQTTGDQAATNFATTRNLAASQQNVIPTLPRNPVPQNAFDKSKARELSNATENRLQADGNAKSKLNGGSQPVANGDNIENTIRPTLPTTPSAATTPTQQQPNTGQTNSFATTNRSVPTTLPTINSTVGSPVRNASNSGSSPGRVLSTGFTKPIPDRQYEGVQSPSVTIEKIAPREIQVNTPADFQLIVKNVGRITANQVEVHDRIPQGTELMQAMPQAEQGSGGQISWKLGALKPGQEKRIDIRLKPTTPGVIGSVAHVTFAAQASMRTRVTKPVLSIRHKTQPKVMIGDSITLDIVVKNEGDGPATNVYVQEDVPQQLAFGEGIRELEYPLGTLAPGQSKSLQLTLKATSVGRLNNTVVAFGDGGLQSQHGVDVEVVAPNLLANTDGPRKRYLRRKATHELTVQNSGTARATNVEMVARLPGGLQFLSANNRGKYDRKTHAVYWSMAELGPGQTARVNLTTLPLEPGDQNIRFETVADLQQSASHEHIMNVEHLTDIFFDLDDVVDPIEVDSQTIYSVRIVNQGTKTETNVQLLVDMPEGIQPISVEGDITSEIRNQEILFAPITSLNPGDEIALRIHAKGIRPGDHRIAINLQSDGREINVTKQESTKVYSDR